MPKPAARVARLPARTHLAAVCWRQAQARATAARRAGTAAARPVAAAAIAEGARRRLQAQMDAERAAAAGTRPNPAWSGWRPLGAGRRPGRGQHRRSL